MFSLIEAKTGFSLDTALPA